MKHTNNPTEAFIEAVNSLVVLSQVARQQLNECLNVRCFDPRHLLLPKSHTFDGVFFIHSGLVRGFIRTLLERKQVSGSWRRAISFRPFTICRTVARL